MSARKLLAPWLCLVTLASICGVTAGTNHQPPYDPRPLMQAADPSGDGPFTFAVFGDSYAKKPLDALLRMISARSPTFAITTGDMVFKGSDWDYWSDLERRAGWFFASIPTWPVVGNHEWTGDDDECAHHLQRFYGLPQESYAFAFRNSKFIVLGDRQTKTEQLDFLRRELSDRSSYVHVFVFRHVPFYTVGAKGKKEVPGSPNELTSLFEQHHVTAVFTGHDHIYHRTRRQGIDYITAGIAGAGIYELKRVGERLPGDSYMGRIGENFVLRVSGKPARVVPRRLTSAKEWLFAVFVQVGGQRVAAETVSVGGEVWEQFSL